MKRKAFAGLALAAVVAVAAASSASGSQHRQTTAHKRALTSITYSTSFGNFGRDAYAWVALEKGYFRDAGFDVKIVPGAGSVAVAQAIAAGSVDFGPADVAAVALARAESGVPVRLSRSSSRTRWLRSLPSNRAASQSRPISRARPLQTLRARRSPCCCRCTPSGRASTHHR